MESELIVLKRVRDWFDKVIYREAQESGHRPKAHLTINLRESTITLDKDVHYLREDQALYLHILFERKDYVTISTASEEMKTRRGGKSSPRPDRIKLHLPSSIHKLLETNSKGTRIKPEYLE